MHHPPREENKSAEHQTYEALCINPASPISVCSSLTEVDVVVASPLPVHLVDEETGDGLEEQAKDGHAHTEAKCVPVPLRQALGHRVKDSEVDDVCHDGHDHPQKELLGKRG